MKLLLTLYLVVASLGSNLQQSEWTVWKKTPCYNKIDYRYRHLRTHGARHVFEIQFKNQYKRTIFFDYALASSQQDDDMHHARRATLPAGQESKSISLFSNSEEFLIEVGRLAFYPDDTEYEACDNEQSD